jgi:hypothetical protein
MWRALVALSHGTMDTAVSPEAWDLLSLAALVILITWWINKHKQDLMCECRHLQSEHYKNFGLGGACRRCDCPIFKE